MDDGQAKRISKQIDAAFGEVARLSGMNQPPTVFYQEFLNKVVGGIDGRAGAVWLRTPQGFLQLQSELRIDQVGLDNQTSGRQYHNELLRQTFQSGRGLMLEPGQTTGVVEGAVAANATEFVVMLAPVLMDEKTPVGLVEIWIEHRWDPKALKTFYNYLVQMAGYASNYVRNMTSRPAAGAPDQLWTQLESFASQIHSSLNPTEVAYQVANEGRRLVACDRISVAVRYSRKCKIEAVSGADVVEKSSTHIRLMRELCDAVIAWDEKLVYKGTKDDTLPPNVLAALDAYLAESNSKLLVLQPLRDEREKDKLRPPRSALLMECYEPPAETEPLINRLDVVARHAGPSLYNAVELKRIPFRFLWLPVAKIQEGLGGKTKAIVYSIGAALVLLTIAMILVPYPLKLDSNGQLVPEDRHWVYSSTEGEVRQFIVEPGAVVQEGQSLVLMFSPELGRQITQLQSNIDAADTDITRIGSQLRSATQPTEQERLQLELGKSVSSRSAWIQQLAALNRTNNSDPNTPGVFRILAPRFPASKASSVQPRWTVLNSDFRENLTYRTVKPSDPLLRLGNKSGNWELELKIPQKHIGQILKAFPPGDKAELDVDLLVTSVPTKTFRGKLARDRVAGEAVPNKDDHNESEPIVFAYVRVSGNDIPEDMRIPRDLLVTGVEVHAKVRCGDHAMGYSLFYGVWEFLYEKVIFFF
jgi:hypothetical protein